MDRRTFLQHANRPSARVYVTLVFFILIDCLLAASTWHVYSNTWDEPEHIAAGVELLDQGKYEYDTEHPPIARALIALGPYLVGAHSYGTPPPDGTQEGIDILYSGNYDLYLSLARLGTLPFLALLLWVSWLWARRVSGSDYEALLAVLLVGSVPPLLGHAALATLDVPAAATILLAFYAVERWMGGATWRSAIALGSAVGLAIGCKFSAIPFIGLAFLALAGVHLLDARRRPAQPQPLASAQPPPSSDKKLWSPALRRALGLALAAAIALLPVVLAYEARYTSGTGALRRFDWATAYLLQQRGIAHVLGVFLAHVALPKPLQGFIEGIVAVKAHNDSGHLSYLLGTLKKTGWWYFYLVALAVKTPLPLLAAGPLGLGLLARDGWRRRDSWRLAPAVLFLTVLLFASLFSRINIGIRHVLVLYPLLALGAARAFARAWELARGAQQRYVALGGCTAVLLLIGWQMSTLWSENPDYLPYFNETVRHPEKVLVDSDLDWGQDLRRLEWALRDLKVPRLALAYQGTADLTREPLPPFTRLVPGQPVTGWVAISALAREHYPKGFAWLDAYTPVERIGKTIELYDIPEPVAVSTSATPPR